MDTFYIINEGNKSGPFNQVEAEGILAEYLEKNTHANLRQAMNTITSGRARATGNYSYDDNFVLHVSSGCMYKSVSIFFFIKDDAFYLIAMGECLAPAVYLLSHVGQKEGNFKLGKKILL
ncbi:hypothetical protein JFY74_00495 [Pectobacterium carotovorum]|uniref:hypothetical protein n=1 Tax=Pectobacterium versatile TaxID=2488639 RepID=UPI0018ED3A60|nr:hypothetical protein [Pectobacterium versatile]QQG28597.1 hypothetical protein JFY74_00495 [Pectobacterium carotovorum]